MIPSRRGYDVLPGARIRHFASEATIRRAGCKAREVPHGARSTPRSGCAASAHFLTACVRPAAIPRAGQVEHWAHAVASLEVAR
jgi:hypothetical protein